MRSAPLFVLLLTLGCAQKHPPELLVERLPASPSAYRGDALQVNGLMTRYSAADVNPVAYEYAFALDVDPSAPTTAPEAVVRPGDFSKGTRFANVYGSTIFGDEGKGEMYLLHVGFGEYFRDYQSISLDLFGGYVRSGIDDNGGAIGLDVVYRNHFRRDENDDRTIFFEGGLGLQEASTNFSGERHFNFRIRVGFGASFEFDDRVRAFLGASYIHISDAGMEGGGGGFDGPMLWGGVTFPF
jgi:hypothetical protein